MLGAAGAAVAAGAVGDGTAGDGNGDGDGDGVDGAAAHADLAHPRGHPATTGAPAASSALTSSTRRAPPLGCSASVNATTPETWGAAILVPVMLFRPPRWSTLRTLWPAEGEDGRLCRGGGGVGGEGGSGRDAGSKA